MTCKHCIHARSLVNKRTVGRVGCVLATDSDWADERIRYSKLDIKQEYIYPDLNSTIRTVGITTSENDICPYFNTGAG